MTTNSSIDQLLDLLIDALEERKEVRGGDAPERGGGSAENDHQPATPPLSHEPTPAAPGKTPLPKRWNHYAASYDIYSMEGVSAEFVAQIHSRNPNAFRQLKKKQWLALKDEALAGVPPSIVGNLPYSLRLELQRRVAVFDPPTSVEQSGSSKRIADDVAIQHNESVEEGGIGEEKPFGTEETGGEGEPLVLDEVEVEPEPEPLVEVAPIEREITHDNLPKTLVRMFIGLIVVIVLANIRIIDFGTINDAIGAAGNEGSTRVVFARDGMLMRADSTKEVYVIENNVRFWIRTPEEFRNQGYSWSQVQVVDQSYLDQFEVGIQREVLAKCPNSPHVFVLKTSETDGQVRERRYITSIEAFSQEGYVWSDIRHGLCRQLVSAVEGETIPPGFDGVIPSPEDGQ